MVLLLGCDFDTGAHMRSDFGYLIYLRNMFRSCDQIVMCYNARPGKATYKSCFLIVRKLAISPCFFALSSKYLRATHIFDLTKLFIADAPMKKKNQDFLLYPLSAHFEIWVQKPPMAEKVKFYMIFFQM